MDQVCGFVDVAAAQRAHLLDAPSLPTLGFPGDVMRDASVVSGVYGAQLPDRVNVDRRIEQ